MVGVTIGPHGEVATVEVVKTSGYPNLDKSALAAVRLWRAHEQYAGRRVVVPVEFAPRALRRR
jgi:TonB family protein